MCQNSNQGIVGKTKQAGLWSSEESSGLFEVDNSICHLNDQWTKIEAVMDSGAAEWVAFADVAPWVPISESACSRRGQTYMSARGENLRNLGEKQMTV